MNKKILTACIIGMALIPSMGQSVNMSGIVTDKATGAKISGATVKILKAGSSTLTDINGAYQLTTATGLAPKAIINRNFFDLKLNQTNLVLFFKIESENHTSYANLFNATGKLVHASKPTNGLDKMTPSELIPALAPLAKTPAAAVVVDTLQVTKIGYEPFKQAIDVYTATINVALTSQGIGCAAATVCWNFETGALPVGSRAAQLPGEPPQSPLPKVDKLQAHSGVYAMHLDTLSGKPKRDIEFDLPPNFGPVLWGRVYLYITPNGPMPVDPDPSAHGAFFKGLYTSPDTAGLYWYENGFDLGKYFQMQHIPEPPGYPEWTLYTNQVVSSSKWECVEWEMDGTLPSEPKLFIDGVEVIVTERKGWTLNYFFTDKPINLYKKADNFKKFWLGLDMYHTLHDKTELWFDDFAVASKRVGCN